MLKKKGLALWDCIAWITLAGIALWLVLKVTGVINTSAIVEYSPVFGAVYLAGWAMHKLDRATEDIRDVKENVKSMEENVKSVERDIDNIETGMDNVEKDTNGIKRNADNINADIALIRKNCPLFVKG